MKLDLGCGKNKREGFLGVDVIPFETVDFVADISKPTWTITKECYDDIKDDAVKACWEEFPMADNPFAYRLKDNVVDEAHSSHTIEHLTATQRIAFVNELYRVMKPGAKASIIAPHWGSCRAYGDMTHQWPPVSEFWFYYLAKSWRATQAPHDDIEFNPNGYSCDFEATWGYGMNQMLHTRNAEFQQFAMSFYKEAIQDIYATLTKPAPKDVPNV
jgi:SAM-dependent methyltransferase